MIDGSKSLIVATGEALEVGDVFEMVAVVETLLHVWPGRVIVHHCASVRLPLSRQILIRWRQPRGVRLISWVHFAHKVLQLVVLEVFDQRVARFGLLFEVRGYLLVLR